LAADQSIKLGLNLILSGSSHLPIPTPMTPGRWDVRSYKSGTKAECYGRVDGSRNRHDGSWLTPAIISELASG